MLVFCYSHKYVCCGCDFFFQACHNNFGFCFLVMLFDFFSHEVQVSFYNFHNARINIHMNFISKSEVRRVDDD